MTNPNNKPTPASTAGRKAYLHAKAGKGLSPVFETVDEGKRWIAEQRRLTRRMNSTPSKGTRTDPARQAYLNAKAGIGVSRAYDNADEFIADLHTAARRLKPRRRSR